MTDYYPGDYLPGAKYRPNGKAGTLAGPGTPGAPTISKMQSQADSIKAKRKKVRKGGGK